ncbi:RPA49 [Candida pseudojiufengensis]|uniref:RPA49 n=1 Tax=Candida pseudojiufengensis TaxID=497109 RepID=UPI002224D13E|nr:RPA49 [Candida pseudojiufengensis]KAI5964613.1 RPA49 [Candida pseudojiufengensis]
MSSKSSQIKVNSYTKEPVAAVGSFFNGLSVPPSTEFNIYQHKKKQDYIIHGESQHLDYDGDSQNNDNDYVLAIYDPNTKSVDLYQTPYLPTKVSAKRNKIYKGPSVKSAGLKNNVQRNALGEAFGTKKAKQAISNLEKNRIDSEKLQDMQMDIVDTVQESTVPTTSTETQTFSIMPKPNVSAKNVEDVYPINKIIPDKDWNYIRVQSFLSDSNPLEQFPSQPEFVKSRLSRFIEQQNIEKLQMLYYASLLFGVYENRKVSNKNALLTRLQNKPSEALIDGILSRFTINRASNFGKSKDRSFTIDPNNEDKILCYLILLLLHLSNFSVELNPLAKDLKLKPTKLVSLFRAVGATIKSATVAEAEALGIPKSSAGTYKIANMKVPFKLPDLTRRGARR